MKQLTLFVILFLLLLLAVFQKLSIQNKELAKTASQTTAVKNTALTKEIKALDKIKCCVADKKVIDTMISYDEKPAATEATYFEKLPVLDGQQAYIAYPITIDLANLPTLIIYSHGSNSRISTSFSEEEMQNMRMYGALFTANNFAFAASNMHGVNWGNNLAVADMKNLVDWLNNNYKIKNKVNLLSHSMGSRAIFNFAFNYPDLINSIILLAPVSRNYSQTQMASIKNIPIQIWHGDSDTNVFYTASNKLLNRNKSCGFENMNVTILPGKTHWDVDTELASEILEYYKKHKI
jgi:hypothetical protein